MISTFGASPEQAERFIGLYQAKTPIRAAAHEAGISIIQATMIARHSGILRLTEGFIVKQNKKYPTKPAQKTNSRTSLFSGAV